MNMSESHAEVAETAVRSNQFIVEEVLPSRWFDEITEIRIHSRRVIEQEARRRKKRYSLTENGKLVLAALDHAARGVTEVGSNKLAMGDRHELLARARRVLADPNLDGLLVTGDVLEELLILNHLERREFGASFLDRRILVGSMNRGGLAGAEYEMEDAFTALSARRLKELRCDGGKMLCRLDARDPASGRTLLACAESINRLRAQRLDAFIEPLAVEKRGSEYHTLKDAASLIRVCGIASALGDSSIHMWLKIPYGEDYAAVCRATTLPVLMLGGPARESPAETLKDFSDGLAASPRVRGAMIGRNLLFPSGGDPLPMCRALTALVHHRVSLERAVEILEEPCPVGRGRADQQPPVPR